MLAASISAVAVTKGVAASGSVLVLAKGAMKLMAWPKIKVAIVIAAGALTVSGLGFWEQNNFRVNGALAKLPPELIIRPAQLGTPGNGTLTGTSMGGSNNFKMLARNSSFESMVAGAYGWPITFIHSRVVFPDDIPKGEFDVLVTVPDGQKEFQAEIKRQFGFIARREKLDRQVFLLRVGDTNKIAAKNKQAGKLRGKNRRQISHCVGDL